MLKLSLSPQPIRLHLSAVSDDYFALVGVVSKDVQVSLWDVRYFTRQASSLLTSEPHTVCCVSSSLVLCGSEGVATIPVTLEEGGGTLAAALGKGQGSLGTSMSSFGQVSYVRLSLHLTTTSCHVLWVWLESVLLLIYYSIHVYCIE